MRFTWQILGLTLCAFGIGLGSVAAQTVPALPSVPAAPVVAATPAAPAQPANLWTFLCPPKDSLDKCKQRLCDSMFGQLLGSALTPMRMATGGLMKPCCPQAGMPNPADLEKPADSAAGAAARIKQDEAGAKVRRADVRYLGTVDCNRYPEAEKALIKALRTDRNECVRMEAALSLGNGCCCTRDTVAALLLTVNGSDRDGNPIETSPRVKQAAAHALAHCQARGGDYSPEPPEKGPPEKGPPVITAKAPLDVLPVSVNAAPAHETPGNYPTSNSTAANANNRPRGLLQNLPSFFASNSGEVNSSGQRGLLQNFSAAKGGESGGDPLSVASAPRGLLQTLPDPPANAANPPSLASGQREKLQNLAMPPTDYASGTGAAPATDSSNGATGQRGALQTSAGPSGNIPSGFNPPSSASPSDPGAVPTGQRGLFQIFMRRVQPSPSNNTQ